MTMKPFRTSATARIVSSAIAFALLGGGLIPILGINPAIGLPIVLLLSVGAVIAGLVIGVQDHVAPVAFLAILLPLALWGYVLGLLVIVHHYPGYGLGLVAAGILMTAFTLAGSVVAKRPAASRIAPAPAKTA
jgi:hypothetical protein